MKEPDVMPIKKARVSEEVTGPLASAMMEEEGTSKDAKKRKKRSSQEGGLPSRTFPLVRKKSHTV